MTSFGVVARLRRVLASGLSKKPKNTKVGHAGTLDPFATGLLIVATGNKCKLINQFVKSDKTYEATIRLGTTSTTGDPEGELHSVSSHQPAQHEVLQACQQFTGIITQTPPIYSAIKIAGQRAYNLARSGTEFTMPSRQITIYSLDILKYEYPDVQIVTTVSSGTYIRTLAEDIGRALQTGAYCIQLRRTAIGNNLLSQAHTLAEFGIDT